METLNNCPVCNHAEQRAFMSCIDYTVSRETFHIVQCQSCGFRFANPRPDEKEIGKYYQAEEYISHSGTSKGIVNKVYGWVRNYTIKQKVKLINKLARSQKPEARSILDIGCGTGEFLHACKQNGWNVTGIEPSEVARKNAENNFGITPIVPEKLFEINKKKFNAITLWHVLEHVHQLHKTIEQIKNILTDDGTLIVAVPNCDSWDAKKYSAHWAAWDLPRHIYHFTKKDIETLFQKFNFELVKTLPMKFDAYYVSLLSEKYKTGKQNLLKGFLNGLESNGAAHEKANGYSSQIYILKKKLSS